MASWDAVLQDTVTLAKKFGESWANYENVTVGKAYVVYLAPDAPDSAIFSLCCPGYVPFDDAEPWDSLAEPSGGGGFNLIAVPYQRYNTLLLSHGSFPLPARIIGEDISAARPELDITYIARWNPETQSGDAIALNSSGIWTGDDPVYPGEPLMIYIADTLIGIKEHYSTRFPDAFLSVLPNPFNSSVAITVDVGAFCETPLQIEIYDLRGNVVVNKGLMPLVDGQGATAPCSGHRTFIWHPDEAIASGIYIVRARTEDDICITKRIVYIR